MMTYKKYISLVEKFKNNDNREINYQNRIIIPFLEGLFEKYYDIVDVSTQYKNRETNLHTRENYANNSTPDLLIAKNWNIQNKGKANINYCAVVEIKVPGSKNRKQIEDYIKVIPNVIWTDCKTWEFYDNSVKPKSSISVESEEKWDDLCKYLVEFLKGS